VLLRLVDDYLLITTNYLKARDFLEMMIRGGSFPGVIYWRQNLYASSYRKPRIWVFYLAREDKD